MTPQEHAYAKIIDRIGVAARELEACEPTMSSLAGQYSEAEIFSFATNPISARAGIVDAQGSRKAEVELAVAVIKFVDAWRALRDTAEAKFVTKVKALIAAAKDDG